MKLTRLFPIVPATFGLAAAVIPGCATGTLDDEGPLGGASAAVTIAGTSFVPDTATCDRSIDTHYAKNAWLGAPIHWVDQLLPDRGRYRDYAAGTIVQHPRTGCAFFVRYGFHAQWSGERRTLGPRGYPVTDELSPGPGRAYQYFENGSMFWQPSTGVRALTGAVAIKQYRLGAYPISDQTSPDGVGQHVELEDQTTISWSVSSGAWSTRYGIRAHYAALGWENSWLGYPVSDEECVTLSEVTCANRFQYGRIKWTPSRGMWAEAYGSSTEAFMKVPAPGERIAATFIVDRIESITALNGYGVQDDVTVRLSGLHTDPEAHRGVTNMPWTNKLATFKLRAGESRAITQPVFADGDARRRVRFGEGVALHVSIFGGYNCTWITGCGVVAPESEEIGYLYKAFEYHELHALAGQTLSFAEDIKDSRARFRVHYRVIIGRPEHTPAPKPAYAVVDPSRWEGSYDWTVDGHKDTATLIYLPAGPSRAEPAFTGHWNEAGKTLVINTKRIVGNYVELYLTQPGVPLDGGGRSQRRIVGYLVAGPGGAGLAIAGTAWNEGQTWGFFMTRRP